MNGVNVIRNEIFSILSSGIYQILKNLSDKELSVIEEIRIRKSKPLLLKNNSNDYFLTKNGVKTHNISSAYIISEKEIREILQIISRGSIYALEDEFKNGYLTVPGGHRIGFTGEAVLEKGQVKTLKNICSLNIRIAREFKGCSDKVMPYIIKEDNKIEHTLIISPPGCGKTTLLRDIVREISNGDSKFNLKGKTVGVVDERSEIAGCYKGVPQHDVGVRTDVLDKCKKAEGMVMLVRSMAPEVIATDELGGKTDIKACEEILKAGISLLATVHGSDIDDIRNKEKFGSLVRECIFNKYIVLKRDSRPGKIKSILDKKGNNLLSNIKFINTCERGG